MQKFLILGATLALSTVCVLPVTQTLNIGGEAQAMRDGERPRAGNRSGRRNGERARNRNGQGRNAGAARERRETGSRTRRNAARAQPEAQPRPSQRRASRTEPPANQVTRHRFDPRLSRFRDRDLRFERRRLAPRFRRALRRDRFCMRRGRIIRRLHRRGWDVLAFHRAGPRYNARVLSRGGQRYAMSIDACSGRVLSQHSLEKRRHRGVKKVFRKIRKSFKKIF